MVAELKTFKRDWQRWSPAERVVAGLMALAGSTGLVGQILAMMVA
jgi:hypothetical protein